MERVFLFLPSMLVIALIGLLARFYARSQLKKFGNNVNNLEWMRKNKFAFEMKFGSPLLYICAPTIEELLFRAPLIILFSSVTSHAVLGITASAVLFGLMHIFNKKVKLPQILSESNECSQEKLTVSELVAKIEKRDKKRIFYLNIIAVCATTILGLLAGYFGVYYQSIWVAVGIHAAWNMFVPPLLIIVCFFYEALRRTISDFISEYRLKNSRKKYLQSSR